MDIPDDIADLFLHFDGMLYGVYLEDLTLKEVENIYGWLRQHSLPPHENNSFWSVDNDDTLQLISKADNPIAFLASGKCYSFNHQLHNLKLDDQIIDDLGVWVDSDSIELNWGGVADWDMDQISAFLIYLKNLVTPDLLLKIY